MEEKPQTVRLTYYGISPWEMHVRFVKLKKELIAIHAEVEDSRDYLQHLFCQRTPVIYEIENMLKKYEID